jgi:hypothetical protein
MPEHTGKDAVASPGPQLQLKVEVFHDPRNKNADVSHIEQRVKSLLNHPDDRITDIRVSVGRAASGVFVTLIPGRWSNDNLDRFPTKVAQALDYTRYADNVRNTDWSIEAVIQDGDTATNSSDSTEAGIKA